MKCELLAFYDLGSSNHEQFTCIWRLLPATTMTLHVEVNKKAIPLGIGRILERAA